MNPMKKLVVLTAACAALAGLGAAPALGQPETKTELVDLDGATVDEMHLRYDFDAAWVVDNQNILMRDTHRDFYLVTLKEACPRLDVRRERFSFRPTEVWKLRAHYSYEVRPSAGPWCDVGRFSRVDDAKAGELRENANWRAW
jgi:hypothetical protein